MRRYRSPAWVRLAISLSVGNGLSKDASMIDQDDGAELM
jgi:hypothetical protein